MRYDIGQMQEKLLKRMALDEVSYISEQLVNVLDFYRGEGVVASFSQSAVQEKQDNPKGFVQNVVVDLKDEDAQSFGLRIFVPYERNNDINRILECEYNTDRSFLTKNEIKYPRGYGALNLDKTVRGYRRRVDMVGYVSDLIKKVYQDAAEKHLKTQQKQEKQRQQPVGVSSFPKP